MPHQDFFNNGKKLVSVTQLVSIIEKPYLGRWKTKLCQCPKHKGSNKSPFKDTEKLAFKELPEGCCGEVYAEFVKDEAVKLGVEVHNLVEKGLAGCEIPQEATPEGSEWALKIMRLYDSHGVKPSIITPESALVDNSSNLAGSPDLIGEWDGRVEIIDTKIKNSLDSLTAMQGCGYRYLMRRLHGVDIKHMRVVWCKKESKARQVEDVLIDLEPWMEDWKALVKLWNRLNPSRIVTIKDF